jgi:hypothetical protein
MSATGQTLIAYADCFSGVSGDMFLDALLDTGQELDHLQAELAKPELENLPWGVLNSRAMPSAQSGWG